MTRFLSHAILLTFCLVASVARAQIVKYGPWSGALTSNSVEIVAGLIQNRISTLEYGTDRDFGRYHTQAWAENIRLEGAPPLLVRFSLRGLSPDTTYYYRVRAGNVHERERVGSFRTLPLEGQPSSFRFAIAADALSRSESSVYSEIRFQKPRFFIHLGNAHNDDIPHSDLERYFNTYRTALSAANQSELFASVPVVYTWDRLDFGRGPEAAHEAYRQFVPHYPLMPDDEIDPKLPASQVSPARSPITQSFSVGRVRFIILDGRSARAPVDAPDGPGKSMLGAKQLAWLKDELLQSAPTHPLIFIATSTAWHGTDSEVSDDWARYGHERAQIASWIEENKIDGICFLSGNGGTFAINDGSKVTSRSEFDYPEFHVGPIDLRRITFDGEWTQDAIVPKGVDVWLELHRVFRIVKEHRMHLDCLVDIAVFLDDMP